MFLSDPEHTVYDVNFKILGFPVRVHPLFWVMAVVLGWNLRDARQLLLWVLAVFSMILLHELGHSLIMRLYGIHSYIVLYTFGGLAVPVSSRGNVRLRARDEALISFAGCGLQLLFAACVWLGFFLFQRPAIPKIWDWEVIYYLIFYPVWAPFPEMGGMGFYVHSLIGHTYWICIMWSILNLMPIFPLDGGNIARTFMTWLYPRDGFRIALTISFVMALLLAGLMIIQENYFTTALFGMLAFSNYQMLTHRTGYY